MKGHNDSSGEKHLKGKIKYENYVSSKECLNIYRQPLIIDFHRCQVDIKLIIIRTRASNIKIGMQFLPVMHLFCAQRGSFNPFMGILCCRGRKYPQTMDVVCQISQSDFDFCPSLPDCSQEQCSGHLRLNAEDMLYAASYS